MEVLGQLWWEQAVLTHVWGGGQSRDVGQMWGALAETRGDRGWGLPGRAGVYLAPCLHSPPALPA